MESKLPCPLSFLLPLCHAGDDLLEKVGANPIFDRNVIGLVSQFAVRLSSFVSSSFLTFLFFYQQDLRPSFLRKWGARVKGQFCSPCGIAVHPKLDLVFVVNIADHRMWSFRSDGTAVKQFEEQGLRDGEYNNHMWGAATHPTRNCIFITDLHNHQVQVFDVDGSCIRKWGSEGRGNGQFRHPLGIATHPTQDLVYVTDCYNHRVQVFNLDGLFLTTWGIYGSGNGQFNYPWGVAVLARPQDRGLARAQDRGHSTQDLIFISESNNHRIQTFRSDGTFVCKWGSEGSDDGQFFFPRHLSLHPSRDLLFVVESSNARVQVFDLNGSFVCKWGNDGEFDYPTGICVDSAKDIVYVGDDRCVQAFALFKIKRKNQ